MKRTIQIDLRKTNPFGIDLKDAHKRARQLYQHAKDMGPAKPGNPRSHEHYVAHQALLTEARTIHGLLLVIANLAGPEAVASDKSLTWAVNTNDYDGSFVKSPAPVAQRIGLEKPVNAAVCTCMTETDPSNPGGPEKVLTHSSDCALHVNQK